MFRVNHDGRVDAAADVDKIDAHLSLSIRETKIRKRIVLIVVAFALGRIFNNLFHPGVVNHLLHHTRRRDDTPLPRRVPITAPLNVVP